MDFIHKREYLSVTSRSPLIFSHAQKRAVSKVGSDKKRIVYTFPREENYVLKLLTFLLLRKYEHLFAPNLYSFRVNHGIAEAIKHIKRDHNLPNRFVYKLDIHDYFNSVDIGLMLQLLKKPLSDEPEVYDFISSLLQNPYVIQQDGSIVAERKGIMAGTPLSAFLANVYLSDLDWSFYRSGIRYLRYSDDIILFADSPKERDACAIQLRRHLASMKLEVNEKKVATANPEECWNFLGITYQNGIFDISEVSTRKLCAKMRRKSRALLRWKRNKSLSNEKAAKAFVKQLNKKLFENAQGSELTWARWFFPVINTAQTLNRIDRYMQDCIRYIMTEKRTKSRFNFRYADIKALGYRSLVHEYYTLKSQQPSPNA